MTSMIDDRDSKIDSLKTSIALLRSYELRMILNLELPQTSEADRNDTQRELVEIRANIVCAEDEIVALKSI